MFIILLFFSLNPLFPFILILLKKVNNLRNLFSEQRQFEDIHNLLIMNREQISKLIVTIAQKAFKRFLNKVNNFSFNFDFN